MQLTGDVGEVWVGYRRAIVLGSWRFTRTDSTGPVVLSGSAMVVSTDEFWSTQVPRRVALWLGQSWWVWITASLDGDVVAGEQVGIELTGDPVVRTKP